MEGLGKRRADRSLKLQIKSCILDICHFHSEYLTTKLFAAASVGSVLATAATIENACDLYKFSELSSQAKEVTLGPDTHCGGPKESS